MLELHAIFAALAAAFSLLEWIALQALWPGMPPANVHVRLSEAICPIPKGTAVQAAAGQLTERTARDTAQLDIAHQACKQLRVGMRKRNTQAKEIRALEFKEVNHWFHKYLRRRRHAGQIKIDYQNHQLDLEVCPPTLAWASLLPPASAECEQGRGTFPPCSMCLIVLAWSLPVTVVGDMLELPICQPMLHLLAA